ncbi:type II secretion system F family protein [Jidongwangia harbinensis]|uniref:type II secretion system F family protein n=1 Tax=Jidongwangia harbinensis TaxID=2878561 RepID=UPI001CD9E9F8|nr:type II secretion system F family protein [Jidongwangia harbinensis]MCA2214568.1 type II secretion system F family protein [Jidongwangia harbinensis]
MTIGGLATLLLLRRRRPGRRLAGLTPRPRPAEPGRPPTNGGDEDGDGDPARLEQVSRPLIAVAAGLGAVAFIGQWWAVPVGVAVGVGVHRFLRGREPAAVRRARQRAVDDLPLCADLLAAALTAGAPVDRAAAAVADALGGPLGERLARTSRSLRLGAGPPEAWAHLSDVAGAERVAAAAARSSASGGALAGALTRLADDLRADRGVAAEAAARRAGVLIVLPLGLCFLPAFVLAGLVPVVVAVLGDVL